MQLGENVTDVKLKKKGRKKFRVVLENLNRFARISITNTLSLANYNLVRIFGRIFNG